MIPKRIVAIGSSSLYGMVDPDGQGYIGRLRKWLENQNEDYDVFNLGIGGDTTTGMLKRLRSEATIRKPDLILLTSGLNDTRRTGSRKAPATTSIKMFRENIQNLISTARRLCDVVFISVYPIDEKRTTPFKNTKYFYLMADAIEYTGLTEEICKKNNVPYLDIFNQWLKTNYLQYIYDDGLHCNSLGHNFIFEKLKDFLETLYAI